MTIQELQQSGNIIFDTISGSHAYGTNVEGSDIDIRGVYIQPLDEILRGDYIPQISDETNDITYYEVQRFLELLMDGNPNMIELLNVESRFVRIKTEEFDYILEHKKEFLTEKLIETFGGYAQTQIKKSKGLGKKIFNPQPEKRKDILEFCYVIRGSKSIPFWDWFSREYSFEIKDEYMSNKEYFLTEVISKWGLSKVQNGNQLYVFYEDDGACNFRGIIKSINSTDLRLSSIPKDIEDSNNKELMWFNLDGFKKHCKDHKQYWEWVEKRNKVRYDDNMLSTGGYDCFLDFETEYLTENGWKKFDEITPSCKLATISKDYKITYQNYIDRVDKLYTGDIFIYEDSYTRFSVTPNHNLYVSKFFRNNENKNSRVFSEEKSKWDFTPTNKYVKNKGESHYVSHLCSYEEGKTPIYTDEWVFLAGVYLGDGHIQRNSKGFIKEVRISQLETKPLFNILNTMGYKKYKSKISKGGQNWIFSFSNKSFNNFIIKNFDFGSKGKSISKDFSDSLNTHQLNIFLEGLFLTDGHYRKDKKGKVYYSTNKKVIDDLQLILYNNGIYSQIYSYNILGGYSDKKYKYYHLYIPSGSKKTFRVLQKKNFKKVEVINERITCFTVPNQILITRNNNKISVQGNTKNMLHVLRLLYTLKDVVIKNEVIVYRPEREYLVSIRKGSIPFSEIMEKVDKILEEIKSYNHNLKKEVDKEKIKDLLLKIRKYTKV